jgi:hypothetical protein
VPGITFMLMPKMPVSCETAGIRRRGHQLSRRR